MTLSETITYIFLVFVIIWLGWYLAVGIDTGALITF